MSKNGLGRGEYAWWKYLNRPVPLSKESDLLRSVLNMLRTLRSVLMGELQLRNGMDAGGVEALGIPTSTIRSGILISRRTLFHENEMYGGKPIVSWSH